MGKIKEWLHWSSHLENSHTCLRAEAIGTSWSPYSHSREVIMTDSLSLSVCVCLSSTCSNLARPRSFHCINVFTPRGPADSESGGQWGWDGGACPFRDRRHQSLAILKAPRRCRRSLLVPCQSAVSVHSPVNWRINETSDWHSPSPRSLCIALNGVKLQLLSSSLPSSCVITKQFFPWDGSGSGTRDSFSAVVPRIIND